MPCDPLQLWGHGSYGMCCPDTDLLRGHFQYLQPMNFQQRHLVEFEKVASLSVGQIWVGQHTVKTGTARW